MPDHSTWPSGLRYAERAAAGLFVVSGPSLTVLAGGLSVVATVARWPVLR